MSGLIPSTGRDLPAPGKLVRELDKREYQGRLGPGYYQPVKDGFAEAQKVEDNGIMNDPVPRFGSASSHLTTELQRPEYAAIGPGCYDPQGLDPEASHASSAKGFGGSVPRFKAMVGTAEADPATAPMHYDQQLSDRQLWSHGVIFPGLAGRGTVYPGGHERPSNALTKARNLGDEAGRVRTESSKTAAWENAEREAMMGIRDPFISQESANAFKEILCTVKESRQQYKEDEVLCDGYARIHADDMPPAVDEELPKWMAKLVGEVDSEVVQEHRQHRHEHLMHKVTQDLEAMGDLFDEVPGRTEFRGSSSRASSRPNSARQRPTSASSRRSMQGNRTSQRPMSSASQRSGSTQGPASAASRPRTAASKAAARRTAGGRYFKPLSGQAPPPYVPEVCCEDFK